MCTGVNAPNSATKLGLQGHDIAGTEVTISENVTIVAEFILGVAGEVDAQIGDRLPTPSCHSQEKTTHQDHQAATRLSR